MTNTRGLAARQTDVTTRAKNSNGRRSQNKKENQANRQNSGEDRRHHHHRCHHRHHHHHHHHRNRHAHLWRGLWCRTPHIFLHQERTLGLCHQETDACISGRPFWARPRSLQATAAQPKSATDVGLRSLIAEFCTGACTGTGNSYCGTGSRGSNSCQSIGSTSSSRSSSSSSSVLVAVVVVVVAVSAVVLVVAATTTTTTTTTITTTAATATTTTTTA